MSQSGKWGCFKRCRVCGGKIAESEGHSHCLLCLGEGHIVETCQFCSQFSKQTRRNRAIKVQHHLMKLSLHPTMEPRHQKMKDVVRDVVSALKIPATKSQFKAASLVKDSSAMAKVSTSTAFGSNSFSIDCDRRDDNDYQFPSASTSPRSKTPETSGG